MAGARTSTGGGSGARSVGVPRVVGGRSDVAAQASQRHREGLMALRVDGVVRAGDVVLARWNVDCNF